MELTNDGAMVLRLNENDLSEPEHEAIQRAVDEWGINPMDIYNRAWDDLRKLDKSRRAFVRIVEDGEEAWKQRRMMTKDDWLRVFKYRIRRRTEHAVRQRQRLAGSAPETHSYVA